MNSKGRKIDPKMGVSLRVKFMTGIIIVECLLMAAIILVVEHRMHQSVMDEFLKLGLTIAKNISAVNTNYVATYNYVAMEQNISRTVQENQLAYAMIQLFDGEVAAFAGPAAVKEEILSSSSELKDLDRQSKIIQYLSLGKDRNKICEMSVPITIRERTWAMVRIGLSLENVLTTIKKTRKMLLLLGVAALVLGCLGAALFAGRITRPVAALVRHVEGFSEGNYEQEIQIQTRDEIGYLARRFEAMQGRLKEHIQLLENSNEELSNTNQRLKSVFKASHAINSLKNQNRLYDLIVDATLTTTETFGASLLMVEGGTMIRVVASKIKKAESQQEETQYRHLLEKQPIIPPDYLVGFDESDWEGEYEFVKNTPFMRTSISCFPDLEMLSIPLGQSNDMTGFINLLKRKHVPMADSEIQALSALANQTTTSIENTRLFLKLEESYLSSIKSLAKTLEFKDEYTHGHGERVAEISVMIGSHIRLDEKAIKILYNAALLHDIGKIGIVETILNKKAPLNDIEWRLIRKHPEIGEEILLPILSLKEERKIVRHHHEREDGKGYPDGLSGGELSVPEKVIIVADAFDAMNSIRSYRNTLSPEEIRKELIRNKGKQFDPGVVDVFLEMYEEIMKVYASSQKRGRLVKFRAIGR